MRATTAFGLLLIWLAYTWLTGGTSNRQSLPEIANQKVAGACAAASGAWRGDYEGSISTRAGDSFGTLFAQRIDAYGDRETAARAEVIIASVEAFSRCVTSISRGAPTSTATLADCERKHEAEIRAFDAGLPPLGVFVGGASPKSEGRQRFELAVRAWPLNDEIKLRGEEATFATCVFQVKE